MSRAPGISGSRTKTKVKKTTTTTTVRAAMIQQRAVGMLQRRAISEIPRFAPVCLAGQGSVRSFHGAKSSSLLVTKEAGRCQAGLLRQERPALVPFARPWRIATFSSGTVVKAQASTKPKQTEESVTGGDETHVSQTQHTAPEAGPSTPKPKPTDPVALLPPSPLSVPHPTPPIPASGSINALISDFQLSLSLSHLIPPNPTLPRLSRWLHIGKQLFKFYWNALKVLWADVGKAKEIKKRPEESWTRRETRLVKRTKADLWKLVPFVAILCILEELLPLLVLYAPNSLPSTTILPAQLIRIKDEEQTRRKAALVSYAKSILEPLPSPIITTLPSENIKQLCSVFELGTVAPLFWLRRRLRKHLEFLSRDDEQLRREVGNVLQELSIEEKRLSLAERGIIALYATPIELNTKLQTYLESSTPASREAEEALKAIVKTIGAEAKAEAAHVEARVKQIESHPSEKAE